MEKNFHLHDEHMIRSTLNVAHALDIISDIDIILKAIKLAIKFYTRSSKWFTFLKLYSKNVPS